MLKSAIIKQDFGVQQILNAIGQGGTPNEVEKGIYLMNGFSLGNDIKNLKDAYVNFETEDGEEWLGSYGVSDSIEQVKEKYAQWLNDPKRDFCISFTEVVKADQSPEWGWRWHKWGDYIGTKEPQYEYLYDEGDDIQSVFVYHIYELT